MARLLPPARKVVRRKRPRDSKPRPDEPKVRTPYKRPAPRRIDGEDE
jgi:hypothetical protein